MSGRRRRPTPAEEKALRVVSRAAMAQAVHALAGGPAQTSEVPASWVYFIRSGADGPIKIGYARDPYTRLMILRSSSPEEVTYLGHVPGARDEEKALHARFAHLRLRGEWFMPGPDLLAFIAEHRFDGDL